jgi:hypothetical protein
MRNANEWRVLRKKGSFLPRVFFRLVVKSRIHDRLGDAPFHPSKTQDLLHLTQKLIESSRVSMQMQYGGAEVTEDLVPDSFRSRVLL